MFLNSKVALTLVLALLASPLTAGAVLVPVVRPRQAGTLLLPVSGGPALARFNGALRYLEHSPQAARIIRALQNSRAVYRVEIVEHPTADAEPHFDAIHNLITWDPASAMEWRGGFSYHARSPALLLMHELGHAYHKELNATQFFRCVARKTADPRWSNVEEKRTILQIENPIARALGESQRFFHEGAPFFDAQLYATVGPTSTQPAATRPVFLSLPHQTSRGDDARVRQKLERALEASGPPG